MKTATVDVMKLLSLADHPRIAEVRAAVERAAQRHTACTQAADSADAELVAAEIDATTGRRDDKRLQRARQACQDATSELRIAVAGVSQAQQLHDTVVLAIERELAADLHARRRAAVRALDQHLDAARPLLLTLQSIEEHFHALLTTSLYQRTELPMQERRTHLQTMQRAAPVWQRVFGPNGLYAQWRAVPTTLAVLDGDD